MAGSYEHCTTEDGKFTFDLIDDMGDAHEACQDMHGTIVTLHARVSELEQALRDSRGSLSFLLTEVKHWPVEIAEIDEILEGSKNSSAR